MPIYTIYKATNTFNKKSYIGIDSEWPKRCRGHKSAAKRGSKFFFHNALRKYGFENFKWEILFQTEDYDHALKDVEPFYIKFFDTFGERGYNMTSGGEGIRNFSHTQETRKKISITKRKNPARPWLGKKRPDVGEKIARAHRNKPKTKEHNLKNSLAIKEKWKDPVWRENMLNARKKK